jgi:hypothetical protein
MKGDHLHTNMSPTSSHFNVSSHEQWNDTEQHYLHCFQSLFTKFGFPPFLSNIQRSRSYFQVQQ